MGLTSDLISQFVKATKDEKKQNAETTVYGKTVLHNGTMYVQIDGANPEVYTPVSTTADVKENERVAVLIKNHTATIIGNASSPAARTGDVGDLRKEMNNLVSETITVDQLNAQIARIDSLVAEDAVIRGSITASDAEIDTIQTNVVTINKQLIAASADIKDLKAEKLDADVANITYATINDLNATDAKVYSLEGTYGDFAELTTNNFAAVNGRIDNLGSTYAKITDLNSVTAEIANLEADVADIDTLMFGSAAGNTLQTSFANAVIAQLGDAQIKSAMIESVSADKITAGDIVTNNVRVKSEDGSLLISDETMQISDENRVRVQIGKDASGDYSINVWDQNGNLMFSKGGITDSAIKSAIIRNDMVSDTANIAAHKLDIDSLFEEINDSSNTIKSTKVYLDDKKQTLDVAFKALTTETSELGETVSSQSTQITALQGQIASKIWQQDIDTAANTMSTQYSTLEQELDGVAATVASHTSQMANKADSSTVTTVNDKVTALESNLNGFKTTVSDTYATKTAFDNLKIGGKNLLKQSASLSAMSVSGNWRITEQADGYSILSIATTSTSWEECQLPLYTAYGELTGTVTISFEFNQSVDKLLCFNLGAYNGTNRLREIANFDVTSYCAITPLTDEWSRATYTFNVDNIDNVANATGYKLQFKKNTGLTGSFSVRKPKLEIGTKPTDWSPAPEDLANIVDFNALVNRVNTAETKISQNEDEIVLKATKTEVAEAIDSIAIGGRNLVRDSKLDIGTGLWGIDRTHQTVSFENGYLEITKTFDDSYSGRTFNSQHSTDNPLLLPDDLSGGTYVLSVDLKAVDGVPVNGQGSVFWRINYDFSSGYEEVAVNFPTDLTTEWARYYTVRTFGTHNYTNAQISVALANANNGICVRNIKLERATKPSVWTPASEDVESRVSSAETSITQNANSITAVASRTTNAESAISSLELTADGLTTRLSSAETNINTRKRQKPHEADGTSGTKGYVGFCTITVTSTYVNVPVTFSISNRGQQSSNISFCLNSINGTDPTLNHIQSDGGINVWAYKSATSTWVLIAQKSEGYDVIYVNDYSCPRDGLSLAWSDIHYDSLPTSNITEATRLAGKLTKATVDNAAKTATNYLNFSGSGLVVGDMTANTLGKNVLIDSDSVDIRNNTTTLASFGATTITLGQNADGSTIRLCDGAGAISAQTSESSTSYPKYDSILIESQEINTASQRFVTDVTNSYGATSTPAIQNDAEIYMLSDKSSAGSFARMVAQCKTTSTGAEMRSGVSSIVYDEYQTTHTQVYAYDSTDTLNRSNRIDVYPHKTVASKPIFIDGVEFCGSNKVLWSGGYYMSGSQTATLSEAVSAQANGIVLVFSRYSSSTVQNYHFNMHYVPKQQITTHGGCGHAFTLTTDGTFGLFACKYVYIHNTKIVGNDVNTTNGTGSCGITYNNGGFVLRYVIGV